MLKMPSVLTKFEFPKKLQSKKFYNFIDIYNFKKIFGFAKYLQQEQRVACDSFALERNA